jgi:leucyl aminopeptidase (aminopeptidase T)
MDSVQEMKGASIVVDTCAAVEPGEDVLVVSDWEVADVAERVAAAANERDANVSMTLMDPREYDGNEPDETVAAAMMEADVIIMPVHRSITHSSATKRATENGARAISMVKFTPEQLTTGGLYADYEGMRPHCEEMARKFTEADEARVTSPQGTDVTVGLEGRTGNAHPGIADEPGEFTALVHIESNISPVEGTTEGTVVFDGAIPNLDIGVLDDPVIMEIEDGAVTSVEGGREANRIASVWAEHVQHRATGRRHEPRVPRVQRLVLERPRPVRQRPLRHRHVEQPRRHHPRAGPLRRDDGRTDARARRRGGRRGRRVHLLLTG